MADEPTPYVFRAPLSVCVDFKNPKAYLALAPTFALADELGIAVDWFPLLVSPLTSAKPASPDDDRGARHRRARALYNARDLRRYAADRGLELGDLYRAPDASVASVGLLWAKAREPKAVRGYLERVFERYWSGPLRLDAIPDIGAVLDELGVSREGLDAFAAGPGLAELEGLQSQLRAAGLFDVPGYVVGDEIFLGRQHLPMIRWLLTERKGPVPL